MICYGVLVLCVGVNVIHFYCTCSVFSVLVIHVYVYVYSAFLQSTPHNTYTHVRKRKKALEK
jgi:hypothetical protein